MFYDYIPDYTEQHSAWEDEQDRLYERAMRDSINDTDGGAYGEEVDEL